MRILAVGDIVGETGVEKLKSILPKIKEEEKIDFTITNGENSAGGMGITEKNFNDMLQCGTDVVTMGNHTWGKRDIFKFIDHPQIIRPINYPKGVPGKGYGIYECNAKKIAVINAIGRVDINILTENPFLKTKEIVEKIEKEVDMIFIDFHAEATAEKIALGYYLDGKVTGIFGTHTHVQTADETILPRGTGYITDIGMTGPKNSVIGMDISASVKRLETALPERYKLAEGECKFNGVIFETDDENNKIISIKRVSY
ncbi:MAG: TIGR00282 family metallophosphoesterase [Clostridia bacterium]|nr:TIGR00282 family metallophosphoesterase [Clostridia bacterium]